VHFQVIEALCNSWKWE